MCVDIDHFWDWKFKIFSSSKCMLRTSDARALLEEVLGFCKHVKATCIVIVLTAKGATDQASSSADFAAWCRNTFGWSWGRGMPMQNLEINTSRKLIPDSAWADISFCSWWMVPQCKKDPIPV